MFKEGWIVVNGVPSHVLTWGGWIEDDIKGDEVLVMITGNPGVTDFYVTFLSTLHFLIDMPVWVISFAGCEIPVDKSLVLPSLRKNKHLFNLSGQIEHKAEFIRKYIPEKKSVYLIGHSVGGKIAVELIKKTQLSSQIKKAYLLFPTLEHIAQTRNGGFVMKYLRYLIPFTIWLTWIFSFFPEGFRRWLVHRYFKLRSVEIIDECCFNGVMKLLNHNTLRGVLFLAMDEMYNILDLEPEKLNKFSNKLNCYYSRTDGWAPLSHYENMKRLCPGVKASVVDSHIEHAFVLFTPEEVAHNLSEEINEDKKQKQTN